MPFTTSQATGRLRAPIQANVKTAGTLVPHRLRQKPASIWYHPIGTSNAGAAVLTYDYANSTATNLRLYSNVNDQTYVIIPIPGPAPVAVTVTDV